MLEGFFLSEQCTIAESVLPLRKACQINRIVARGTLVILTAAVLSALLAPGSALATENFTVLTAQSKLTQLGLGRLVGPTDGLEGQHTDQALCVFRTLVGLPGGRAPLTPTDHAVLARTVSISTALRPFDTYLTSDLTCQVLFEVKGHRYIRIVPISSGHLGFETPVGTYRIGYRIPGWHESPLFKNGMMWDSQFFNGDIAFHGSNEMPTHVETRSHGCVRMFVPDATDLSHDFGVGTLVFVTRIFQS